MSRQSLYSEIIAIQSNEIEQTSRDNLQTNLSALHGKYTNKSPYDIFGLDDTKELDVKLLSSKRLKVSTFLQTEMHNEPSDSNHIDALLELFENAYASIA
ncbi:MAG: hypothetical protein P1U34_12175 [Coxiellaceae bacterium]|nr:hypothetical protein [Coxiellaceae bacterium]